MKWHSSGSQKGKEKQHSTLQLVLRCQNTSLLIWVPHGRIYKKFSSKLISYHKKGAILLCLILIFCTSNQHVEMLYLFSYSLFT